jgi:hypothetical protein
LRFTVHRPPHGEVSLCCYRPPGGDVACCVHVGVARPRIAGDAREDRLALAVFGCDVPTDAASLRRVRGWDGFDAARSFVIKPGNQSTPPLTTDLAVDATLLRNPSARLVPCAARRASHRPHVEVLHSNHVEAARQICRCLLQPILPPVDLARFDSRDRQLRAPSAVGAPFGACQVLLQPAQPHPFSRCQAWAVQQLAGGQRRRHCHTAIDTDHAVIGRPCNRVRDMGKGDMPTPGAIPSDAIRLDTGGHRACPMASNPPDLGYPHPPVTPVELFDMARLHRDLPKALIYSGLAPRRSAMVAGEEVRHRMGEVPQRLLLHRLRPGRQPLVFGSDLSQLRALRVIARAAAATQPKALLLHGQIPNKPRMPAMLRHGRLLNRRRQQPKPRHNHKVAAATDTSGHCASARSRPVLLAGTNAWIPRRSKYE